jgi:hypothetical protein
VSVGDDDVSRVSRSVRFRQGFRLRLEDAENACEGYKGDKFFRYYNGMRQNAEFVTAITVKFPWPSEICSQMKSNHNASSYFL